MSPRATFRLTILAAACLLAGRPAGAAEPPATSGDACAAPPGTRPPDPRCHERLDGRDEPEPSAARTAGRLVLAAPRLASRVVFWPIVQTGGLVESYRLYDWMKALLTSDDGRIGVRPELSYSTSFLVTGGARLFFKPTGDGGGKLVARAHSGGPSAWLMELSLQGATPLGLRARAGWSRRPDRLFGGIGPVSLTELEARGQGLARYAADSYQAELAWTRSLPWRLTATVAGDLQGRDYSSTGVRGGPSVGDLYALAPESCAARGLPAGCLDPEALPGFERGLRVAHAGAGLSLHLGNQDRDGRRLQLALDGSWAEGLAGDPSRHVRLGGGGVLGLGGTDRLLLLRLRTEAVEELGRGPIPFEELVTPAGAAGLRGLADGRLRGASGWVASAEYRWFIAFNLDASVFVDVGSVAGPRFDGLSEARLFPTVGLGLRLFDTDAHYWKARVVDGLQIAYGWREGGLRVLFSTATF